MKKALISVLSFVFWVMTNFYQIDVMDIFIIFAHFLLVNLGFMLAR